MKLKFLSVFCLGFFLIGIGLVSAQYNIIIDTNLKYQIYHGDQFTYDHVLIENQQRYEILDTSSGISTSEFIISYNQWKTDYGTDSPELFLGVHENTINNSFNQIIGQLYFPKDIDFTILTSHPSLPEAILYFITDETYTSIPEFIFEISDTEIPIDDITSESYTIQTNFLFDSTLNIINWSFTVIATEDQLNGYSFDSSFYLYFTINEKGLITYRDYGYTFVIENMYNYNTDSIRDIIILTEYIPNPLIWFGIDYYWWIILFIVIGLFGITYILKYTKCRDNENGICKIPYHIYPTNKF